MPQRAVFLRLAEHIRRTYEAMGVEDPPGLILVLYCIAGHPSELTISESAEYCGMTLNTTSRMVKALRDQGWVALRLDDEDERAKRLRLTASGERVAEKVYASARELMNGLQDAVAQGHAEQQ